MISGCLNISLYLCTIYAGADTALGPGGGGEPGVKGRPGDAFFRSVLGDMQRGPWSLRFSAQDTPKISRGQMLFLRLSLKAVVWPPRNLVSL